MDRSRGIRGSAGRFPQRGKGSDGQAEICLASAAAVFGGRGLRRCAESEGSALVEFALVVPLMLALILGMVGFGICLNNYIILTDAVGAGARALALSRGQTSPTMAATDPCAYAVQVANSDATGLNTANITYNVSWTSGATTNSYTKSCAGIALNSQDVIQLQASYPVSVLLWGGNKSMSLQAHTSELVQ